MRVIGVGDNVVDKYLYKKTMYPGGNALNFSVYAKQLGLDTAYLGVFGNDHAANHIIDTMHHLKVDISHCRQHPGENGYAEVDLVDGDRVFIGGNAGVQNSYPIVLSQEDLEYIQNFELAHSSIYSGMETELSKLKETGILVSFDFSTDYNESVLTNICPHVDISLLSCGQLQIEEVKDLLLFVHSLGSGMVIGTMGSRGAMVYNGTNFYQQQPHFVRPVDTLGAGDSFFTAYILTYLQGKKKDIQEELLIKQSLEAGAKFAAQTCLVDGAFGFGIAF